MAVLALLLASCATLSQLQFDQPTVDLDAIEVTGVGVSGGSLVLVLDVFNPNDYDIRTTWVEASLDLEDTHFGTAVLEGDKTLVANSRTQVEIPAEFTWEGVGAGARALLGRGALRYDLETRLRVETSIGGRTVTLRNRGEVPIRDLVR
ncbi:MAG: LEA type 2 family protein [Gemmatimonadota bacterium]|nr:MAG: LEA type 2 family protein [Gemmatimonadota bacterium]